MTGGSSVDDQNKSIEEEEIQRKQACATNEGEIREIPMNTEYRDSHKPITKVTPGMKAVFDLFTWNRARHTWKLRPLEREAAKVLSESYSIETLKSRLEYTQKMRGTEMFPRVDTPSEFLDKMPSLHDFIQKNRV